MNLQILHYPVVNASLVYLSVLYLYDMLLPTYYANFAMPRIETLLLKVYVWRSYNFTAK